MEELETLSNPPEETKTEAAPADPPAPAEAADETAPEQAAAGEDRPAETESPETPASEPLPAGEAAGATEEAPAAEAQPAEEAISADDLLAGVTPPPAEARPAEDAQLLAVLEAIVYITDEPLSLQQIAAALGEPSDRVKRLLGELQAEYEKPVHGLTVREVAGGYKMATKPEHHEAVRNFVKSLKPPLKLSLAALETLAVIAYKQPVTGPEIMEIRGVQGAGVLKTLLDRKLIAAAGRKNVIGKPILYKTTKEFLVQFGLKDLAELPTLKEFEEIGRLALAEPEAPAAEPEPAGPEAAPAEAEPAEPEAAEPQTATAEPAEPEASEARAPEPEDAEPQAAKPEPEQ